MRGSSWRTRGGECVEGSADSCPEAFDGALGSLKEQGLELSEGILDGI